MTLLQRIKQIGKLSPAEQRIAYYYESEYPLSLTRGINQVSAQCKVSVSTVSRFVSRLGYEGFQALKAEADFTLANRLSSPIERYAKKAGTLKKDYSASEHFSICVENLMKTNSRLDPEMLARTTDILLHSRKIFCIGGASSHYLMQYFAHFLSPLRAEVHVVPPDITVIGQTLADVEEGDALMAMAYYRFSSVTVKVARFFRARGNEVILLTDRISSPITPYASVLIPVLSGGMPMFNSRLSAMALLELLINSMLTASEDIMKKRYEVIDAFNKEFNLYTHTM